MVTSLFHAHEFNDQKQIMNLLRFASLPFGIFLLLSCQGVPVLQLLGRGDHDLS